MIGSDVMAEILFYTRNNTHEDPVKDRRGCYKRGMAIIVCRDKWDWSEAERGPAYKIVKCPSSKIEDFIYLLAPQLDVGSTEENRIDYRRRKRVLDLDRWTTADDLTCETGNTAQQIAAIDAKTTVYPDLNTGP